MPDLLKVTTPLINQNQPVVPKSGVDPLHPFSIQDPSRVIQTHNQTELLKQNTGLLEGSEAPVLLLNLLKDPAVAVSYLKNISLLEEIFRLLPANNQTVTPEIERVFQSLMLPAQQVQAELMRQEAASTLFKGELFDFLRRFSEEKSDSPQVQTAVASFLKAANHLLCRQDILDAVANSLSYISRSFAEGSALHGRLQELAARFCQPGAGTDFQQLKEETLELLKTVEGSVQFSSKLSKTLSITVYNLSRYHDGLSFFHEASYRLRQFLPAGQRREYIALTEDFLRQLSSGGGEQNRPADSSQVMDALAQMIRLQSADRNMNASDSAKIDSMLHSLLSSPCNFTPLLHFIVPVLQGEVRAFAEIWINPESDERDMPEGVGPGRHFLMVIDVDSVGRFEAEFFVYGQTVDFSLYCPAEYEKEYGRMIKALPKALAGMPYRLGKTHVKPLVRSRSLMDVFKSLPRKRMGVDVRI